MLVPLTIAAFIYLADGLEGPRMAFAGVATSLAFMAAIFGRPGPTAFVASMIVLGAYLHGLFSEESGQMSQNVRLALIAITAFSAVAYSAVRVRKEQERTRLFEAQRHLSETSRLAMSDQLTGVLNRRGVLEALEEEARWPRSVAIFDLDKLKQINDSYGHTSGDLYIQVVAQRILNSVSGADIVGRWGGDEFILILPLNSEQALKVVRRVVKQVSAENISLSEATIAPKISAGVCQWLPNQTFELSISHADEALYAAKAGGGNSVMPFKTSSAA